MGGVYALSISRHGIRRARLTCVYVKGLVAFQKASGISNGFFEDLTREEPQRAHKGVHDVLVKITKNSYHVLGDALCTCSKACRSSSWSYSLTCRNASKSRQTLSHHK